MTVRMLAGSAAPVRVRGRAPFRLSALTLGCLLVTALVALLVVYPVLILFFNSFQVGQFGTATHVGFDNWTTALRSPKVLDALKNTLTLSAARQSIGIVVGVLVAWLL